MLKDTSVCKTNCVATELTFDRERQQSEKSTTLLRAPRSEVTRQTDAPKLDIQIGRYTEPQLNRAEAHQHKHHQEPVSGEENLH